MPRQKVYYIWLETEHLQRMAIVVFIWQSEGTEVSVPDRLVRMFEKFLR